MLFSHNLYACIEGEIQTSKIKLPLLFSYTLLMFLYVVIAFAQAYSYQGLSIHPIFALTYGYSTLTSQTNNKAIWSEATNKHSTPYQRITLHCAALIYHSFFFFTWSSCSVIIGKLQAPSAPLQLKVACHVTYRISHFTDLSLEKS